MRIFGLIGRSLSHSYSADYFNAKFRETGVRDGEYRNFEIEHPSVVRELVRDLPALEGLNVTMPFKVDIIPFMDEMDAVAAGTGAVNCIRIRRVAGKTIMKGYNTDVAGFRGGFLPLVAGRHYHALVLGSGGAARAVITVLREQGFRFLQVTRKGPLTYDELDPGLVSSAKLIINATSLGMAPLTGSKPAIPYDAIGREHLLYDLIYNPETTGFMQEGIDRGARAENGYRMFTLQADESWRIWHDPLG